LIADEPTSDLDTETSLEIMELFSRINKNGTTILIVTHELDALKFGKQSANHVFRSIKGKYAASCKTWESVLKNPVKRESPVINLTLF